MISHEQILTELEAKRSRFLTFNDDFQSEVERYAQALQHLALLSRNEIEARLATEPTPGALPTPEFDASPHLALKFPYQWSNHEESRQWAAAMLLNHTTFAVDGSQILPTRTFSVPLAAVQVAWFENHHTHDGQYVKDAVFEILAPDDLLVEFNGERQISEQPVNLRRFVCEVEILCRWMERIAGEHPTELPLAFFDSSLVISFADRLQEHMRARYIEAILKLLRTSERTGVPVIGYVDTSYAHDLIRLLAQCLRLPEAERIHDAQMVDELLKWGDRTPLFICARGSADRKQAGILESFAEYRRGVGFVYLKTNATAPPARLDLPRWIFDRGLLNEVIDLVRAEVIVGNGYPYALETADATAVINARDREAFYALFQRFAESYNINFRISQKAASKSRRR